MTLAPLLVAALSGPLLGETVTRGQWLAVVCGDNAPTFEGVPPAVVEVVGVDALAGAVETDG